MRNKQKLFGDGNNEIFLDLSIVNQVELIVNCEQFASILCRFYRFSRHNGQFFAPNVDSVDSIDPVLQSGRKTVNLRISWLGVRLPPGAPMYER